MSAVFGIVIAGRRRGQAMVEAAFVLPIALLMLTGIADMGRLFYYDVTVKNAVREGARRATDVAYTNTDIQNFVIAAAPGVPIPSSGIVVTPSTRTTANAGQAVSVQASYSFAVWTPVIAGLVGSPLSIARTATMRMN
jgi:Flp pilus assembly protein TadG